MQKGKKINSAILLMHSPDRKGLVAAVTDFLAANCGNILFLEQHVDSSEKAFFMRIEWDLKGFKIARDKIGGEFDKQVAKKFKMKRQLYFSDIRPKMAIFASRLSHCLYDILSRRESGEYQVDIPLIISNHKETESIAKKFNIDFHYIKKNKRNKKKQEEIELKLLKKHNIDFIVLARYMQVLSNDFIKNYPNKIINIHHSFLPAFAGARPYHSAYKRGVKIIGATSHYVSSKLDAGPIIEQDVIRVSHADSIRDLMRKGRDLEKVVLSRAVWNHLMRKTMVYKNRVIVFN
jgi:formyltetrahydrofolate deformylase